MNKTTKILVVCGWILILITLAAVIIQVPKALDDGSRERILLSKLLAAGYTFALPRDYLAAPWLFSNRTALLLHDADFKLGGLQTFLRIEKELGIKSAIYVRPNADYFTQSIRILQEAERAGWEIGFQYDCLSRSGGDRSYALELFRAQLTYLRAFFDVRSTDYHGDSYDIKINNLDLYSQEIWEDLQLSGEVYSLSGYSYFSDTNNKLAGPKMEELGSVVLVQLHCDWTK